MPVLARYRDGSCLSTLGPVPGRVIDCEITIKTAAGQHTGLYRLATTLLVHHRHIAWQAARDQVVQAAGVIASTVIDLVGTIGRHVLAGLLPERRLRVSPRIV
ncbi:hypothetical protein GCM10009654_37130 [Streptomyces hebeiensis]|uniref:Uncharacterized protein n=1 Tax=Streptomyces hebeiensis TaxID=229486 RepID=A0ABN1UWM8_9ACTN